MQETMLPPLDRPQAAPPASSRATCVDNGTGLKPETYPERWLRGHYALSPAAAKIIAAELHMADV